MNETKKKEKQPKISRRRFLKLSTAAGAAGAAVGGSVLTGRPEKPAGKIDDFIPVRERDKFPVIITDNCQQMDHKNTVFSRRLWDRSLLEKMEADRPEEEKGPKEPPKGWTILDRALDEASWTIDGAIAGGSNMGNPDTEAYRWQGRVSPERYKFANSEDAAKKVKKAARFLGADLVGIAGHDNLWDYSRLVKMNMEEESREEETQPEGPPPGEKSEQGGSGEESQHSPENMFEMIEPDFPFIPKSVIVIALEMDYRAIGTSPSCIEEAATGLGYSKMAATGYSMANFIRGLGYRAFACGNDVSLSIPYAIAAGLGELGRNGMLITREFGPRVRLVKVYTELEIKVDKPKTFGVWDFCKSCKRCAESCPSQAIPLGDPTFKGETISNNPGVLKWYINPERCGKFWNDNGSDCANCITSCPFNKPAMWHHKLLASMTDLPGAPLHYVMAKMDKLFGFGEVNSKRLNSDFWEKEE